MPERVSMKRVGVFPYLKPDNATSLPFMGGYVAWSGVDYLTILP